jgi:hypothetical protein
VRTLILNLTLDPIHEVRYIIARQSTETWFLRKNPPSG